MPYFLQHFAKNWVKTLVHGTLHKKLLISRRSTSFGMAFGEKPPKLVDLLEISNFLCKVPCTRVLSQFLAKCCKKYGIW